MPGISSIAVCALGMALRTAEDAPTRESPWGHLSLDVAEFMNLFFQCRG